MKLRDEIRLLLFALETNEWCAPLFAETAERLRELLS